MKDEIFQSSEPSGSQCGQNSTILVVDDDPVILKLLQTALGLQGYEVVAVSDAREALAKFSSCEQHFDIVVMDHSMPHFSGMELARRLRTFRADVKMILMSGYGEALDLPPLDNDFLFIGKPFTLPQIFEAIKTLEQDTCTVVMNGDEVSTCNSPDFHLARQGS
jgi:CheY-like chemotaxis protein